MNNLEKSLIIILLIFFIIICVFSVMKMRSIQFDSENKMMLNLLFGYNVTIIGLALVFIILSIFPNLLGQYEPFIKIQIFFTILLFIHFILTMYIAYKLSKIDMKQIKILSTFLLSISVIALITTQYNHKKQEKMVENIPGTIYDFS